MQTVQPQMVIGLGTGRCGTQSLAHLLNAQSAAEVYHEKEEDKIGWKDSEKEIDALLDWGMTTSHLRLVGDVALYYLPYVEYILARNQNVKFICLQRDCTNTVVSYMRQTSELNHWIEHQGVGWQLNEWDHCYPKYDVPDKQSALTLYWYDYYFTATRLQALYPNSFQIFPTEALNRKAGQRAMLAFLGIPEAQMQLAIGIRANTQRKKQWRKRQRRFVAMTMRIYQRLKRR